MPRLTGSSPSSRHCVGAARLRLLRDLRPIQRALLTLGLLLVAVLLPARPCHAQAGMPAPIRLGPAALPLTGPWRFRLGDDPRWALPGFDDRQWEQVDLTAPPGAHDGDVGLPGYVPGWRQRGHADATGFAWYRLRVAIEEAPGVALALAGPTLVDSTYELYVDGQRLGGPGDFNGATPIAYSVRPEVFALPPASGNGSREHLIAVRVWMDPLDAAAETGGMHVAPAIGRAESIELLRQVQWLRTFKGYVVDAVEPFAFLLLAVMAATLLSGGAGRWRWLCAALVLLALLRVNQVTYAWTPYQSLRGYDLATTLLKPLVLAAWVLAWREWFGLATPRWLPKASAALAIAGLALALATRPWFLPDMPGGMRNAAGFGLAGARLGLAGLYLGVLAAALARDRGMATLLAVLAALLVGIGIFASELNALGIPGIWFPFGTGVARGQFAYSGFIALLFGLILARARTVLSTHAA